MELDTRRYLYATSGDLSEGAMGDKACAIEIKQEDYKLIKNFMAAQNDFLTEVFFSKNLRNKKITKCVDRFFSSCEKLFDVGIFTNKYQCRTTWELWHGCDMKQIKRGKYEIVN